MSAVVLGHPGWRAQTAWLAQITAIMLAAAIPLSNALTTIFSVLLALFCLLSFDRVTWRKSLTHPVSIAILGFVALTLIMSFSSVGLQKDVSLAIRKSLRLLYFPLFLPLFSAQKTRNSAMLTFIACIFVSVIAGIINGWAFFKDTIFTSLFIAYAIFMLLHLSVDYKQYRVPALALAIFFVGYLFFWCTGRVGQILCPILVGLFLWQRGYIKRAFFAPASATIGLLIIGFLSLPNSFLQRQTQALQEIYDYLHSARATAPEQSSMGTRLVLATNSLTLVKCHPVMGWGSGAFRQAYAQHAPESSIHKVERANPHNQYLLTWVELGLPGILILFLIFFRLIQEYRGQRFLEGYLGVGLVASIMIGCCINSWLLDFTSAFFFTFFAALCCANKFSRLTT